jgi:hypothetical protein
VAIRLLAATAIATIAFAQFATSWHEATVQHVRCAEHGELTHVSMVSNGGPPPSIRRSAVQSSDDSTLEAHEHCGFVFALHGSNQPPVVRVAVRFEPPQAAVQRRADPAPRPGRAFVLASAPKTSPPSV